MWEKLQKILVERGLTVVDLAKMADVPKTSIYNAKHHDIGFKKMEKIADALDVSL
ncbi:helix-turn-helix domain-containing protein, partial [Streptococcus suis]